MDTKYLHGPLPDGYHDYERRRLKLEWDRRQGYAELANRIDRAFEEHYPTRSRPAGPVCRKCEGYGQVMDDGAVLTCWRCDGLGVEGARIIAADHTRHFIGGIVDRYIAGAAK